MNDTQTIDGQVYHRLTFTTTNCDPHSHWDGLHCIVSVANMFVTRIARPAGTARYSATLVNGLDEFKSQGDACWSDIEADTMAECQQRVIDFLGSHDQGNLIIDQDFNNLGMTARKESEIEAAWNDAPAYEIAFCY